MESVKNNRNISVGEVDNSSDDLLINKNDSDTYSIVNDKFNLIIYKNIPYIEIVTSNNKYLYKVVSNWDEVLRSTYRGGLIIPCKSNGIAYKVKDCFSNQYMRINFESGKGEKKSFFDKIFRRTSNQNPVAVKELTVVTPKTQVIIPQQFDKTKFIKVVDMHKNNCGYIHATILEAFNLADTIKVDEHGQTIGKDVLIAFKIPWNPKKKSSFRSVKIVCVKQKFYKVKKYYRTYGENVTQIFLVSKEPFTGGSINYDFMGTFEISANPLHEKVFYETETGFFNLNNVDVSEQYKKILRLIKDKTDIKKAVLSAATAIDDVSTVTSKAITDVRNVISPHDTNKERCDKVGWFDTIKKVISTGMDGIAISTVCLMCKIFWFLYDVTGFITLAKFSKAIFNLLARFNNKELVNSVASALDLKEMIASGFDAIKYEELDTFNDEATAALETLDEEEYKKHLEDLLTCSKCICGNDKPKDADLCPTCYNVEQVSKSKLIVSNPSNMRATVLNTTNKKNSLASNSFSQSIPSIDSIFCEVECGYDDLFQKCITQFRDNNVAKLNRNSYVINSFNRHFKVESIDDRNKMLIDLFEVCVDRCNNNPKETDHFIKNLKIASRALFIHIADFQTGEVKNEKNMIWKTISSFILRDAWSFTKDTLVKSIPYYFEMFILSTPFSSLLNINKFNVFNEFVDRYEKNNCIVTDSLLMEYNLLKKHIGKISESTTLQKFKDISKKVETSIMKQKEEEYAKIHRQPICIMLQGPPGTGKSYAAQLLCKSLFGFGIEKAYTRNASSEFWDGYKDQEVVIVDEFLSAADDPAPKEVLSLVSSNPFRPPLANIEGSTFENQKGQFVKCKAIILCTNMDVNANVKEINCYDALKSKITLRVKFNGGDRRIDGNAGHNMQYELYKPYDNLIETYYGYDGFKQLQLQIFDEYASHLGVQFQLGSSGAELARKAGLKHIKNASFQSSLTSNFLRDVLYGSGVVIVVGVIARLITEAVFYLIRRHKEKTSHESIYRCDTSSKVENTNFMDYHAIVQNNMYKVYFGELFVEALAIGSLNFLINFHAARMFDRVDVIEFVGQHRNFKVKNKDLKILGLGNDLSLVCVTVKLPLCHDMLAHFCEEKSISHANKVPAMLVSKESCVLVNPVMNNQCVTATMDDYSASIKRTWTYAATTNKGMCGSVLVSNNNKLRGKIVGIHFAGTGKQGFATVVTKELLIKALTDLNSVGFESGTSQYWKSNINIPRCTKTSIRPSKFYGVYEIKTAPAILSSKDPRNIYHVDPMLNAIASYTKVKIPNDVDNIICEQVLSVMLANFASVACRYRVLTDDEIVNGNDILSPIDLTTSAGLPYAIQGIGKKKLFNSDGTMTPRLRTSFNEYENACKNDGRLPGWFIALKDERRKLEKIEAVKTRHICVPPVENTMVFRKYLGCFMEEFLKGRNNIHLAQVGIEIESVEYENMIKNMTSYGDKGFSMDFSGWDISMKERHIADIFDKIIKPWCVIKGAPIEVITILDKLKNDFLFGETYVDDIGFKRTGGVPSGSWMTTLMNCLLNEFYLRYVLLRYTAITGVRFAITLPGYEMEDPSIIIVKAAVYGDDGMVVFSKIVDVELIQKIYNKELNLVITSGDKDGGIHLQHINDITFLKRKPGLLDGRIVPLLDIDTIQQMIMWVTDTEPILVATEVNVNAACRFMIYYGRDHYNTFINKLHLFKDFICRIPSYDELYFVYFVDKWNDFGLRNSVSFEVGDEVALVSDVTPVENSVPSANIAPANVITTPRPSKIDMKPNLGTQAVNQSEVLVSQRNVGTHSVTLGQTSKHLFPEQPYSYADIMGTDSDGNANSLMKTEVNKKWFPTISATWNTTQVGGTRLGFIALPTDAAGLNPLMTRYFSIYRYLSGNFKVRVVVSGNPFYSGRVIICKYHAESQGTWFNQQVDKYNSIRTSLDHVMLDASCVSEAILDIPFVYKNFAIGVTSINTIISMYVFDPLTNVTGSSNSITLDFWLMLDNVDFYVPLSGSVAMYEFEGGVQSVNYYGDIVESNLPTYIKGDEFQIDPSVTIMDKPSYGLDPMGVFQQNKYYNNATGVLSTEMLDLYPGQMCKTDKSHYGYSQNQASFNFLKGKEVYFTDFQWSAVNGADTTLFSIPITVGLSLWTGTLRPTRASPTQAPTYCQVAPNPIDMLSTHFKFWRGSIKLRFDITCTDYHTGKLLFGMNYGTPVPGSTCVQMGSVYSSSFILDKDHRIISITIPFVSSREWLLVPNGTDFSTASGATGPFNNYCLGTFSVLVQQALRYSSGVPNSANVNVFISYGEDFEFRQYKPPLFMYRGINASPASIMRDTYRVRYDATLPPYKENLPQHEIDRRENMLALLSDHKRKVVNIYKSEAYGLLHMKEINDCVQYKERFDKLKKYMRDVGDREFNKAMYCLFEEDEVELQGGKRLLKKTHETIDSAMIANHLRRISLYNVEKTCCDIRDIFKRFHRLGGSVSLTGPAPFAEWLSLWTPITWPLLSMYGAWRGSVRARIVVNCDVSATFKFVHVCDGNANIPVANEIMRNMIERVDENPANVDFDNHAYRSLNMFTASTQNGSCSWDFEIPYQGLASFNNMPDVYLVGDDTAPFDIANLGVYCVAPYKMSSTGSWNVESYIAVGDDFTLGNFRGCPIGWYGGLSFLGSLTPSFPSESAAIVQLGNNPSSGNTYLPSNRT